jgi:hypothetical protein
MESDHPDPPVPDFDRINRAVVLCDGEGNGVVTWYVGGNLEVEIEGVGRQIADLGLDDAPEGVSIWEGRWCYQRTPESYVGAEEWDAWPEGSFRDPTDEEWESIRAKECPWDDSMYHRGPYCGAEVVYRVEGTVDGKHVRYEVCEAHKDWPATRFTPGEELRAARIGEMEKGRLGRLMRQAHDGCYAEKDGWKEEWDAYEKRLRSAPCGECEACKLGDERFCVGNGDA